MSARQLTATPVTTAVSQSGAGDEDRDISSQSDRSSSQRATPVTSPRVTTDRSEDSLSPAQALLSPRATIHGGGLDDVASEGGSDSLVELTSLTYSEREVELLQQAFVLLVRRCPAALALLFAFVRKGDHDSLAACLVHLALGHEGGAGTLPLLQHFLREEFEQRARDGTVMRENALASKLVKAYLSRVGTDYLVDLLGKMLSPVNQGKDFDLEIDTDRVDTDEAVRNLPRLERKVAELLERLVDSVDRLPPGLRLVAQFTASLAGQYLPDLPEQQSVMVGAIIFLRYINPAIATPEVVRGMLKAKVAVQPRQRRGLVLMTKILQCLSNRTLFGSKESYMIPLNAFVKAHQEQMKSFFGAVLDYQCNPALIHEHLAAERRAPDPVDLQRFHALLFARKDQLLSLLASSGGGSASSNSAANSNSATLELEQILSKLGSYQHKLSFAFLDTQDQVHVSRILDQRQEEAVYVGAADASTLGEKKTRALVLIVGRYTLVMLKRASGRVYLETHLLDLIRVGLDGALVSLVLHPRLVEKSIAPNALNVAISQSASPAPGAYAGAAVGGARQKLTSEPMTIALQCTAVEHATQIVLAIRRQYRASFSGVPSQFRLEVRGLDSSNADGSSTALGACGGVVDTYRALCVYYDVQPNNDLSWDLAYLYARSRTLDLDRFIALKEASTALSDRDALPLLHALGYNTYFTRIELRGLKFDRATLQGVVQLVAHNATLRTLVLRGLSLRDHSSSASWGLFLVFDAMRESAALALSDLECAQLDLNPKDCQALAAYLLQATSSFSRLDLSSLYAGSSSHAEPMRALLWALANNSSAFKHLADLSLNGNRLESLEADVGKILAKRDALQRLDLSDTRLKLARLPIPRVGLEQLHLLVLSQQRLTQDTLPAELFAFLTSTSCTLEQLDLSSSQLSLDAAIQLVRIPNDRLRLRLNLSNNGYNRDAAQSLASALRAGAPALVALDLSDNPLGDEGVQALAEALYHHHSLTALHVDRTFRYSSVKARRDCVSSLAQLLKASALPLATLTLSASTPGRSASSAKDKDSRLKDSLSPLLLELCQARRLTAIDISGHSIGDSGIIALGKALEITRSLRRVVFDDNGCTLTGLRAIGAAMRVNRSVTELALPLLDVARMLSQDDPEKVNSGVVAIDDLLRRNQRL